MVPFARLRNRNYPVTTVVGSSKFKEKVEEVNRMLVSMGHQVLTMHIFGHADGVDQQPGYVNLKRMFDAAYMDKIERSDGIFVVNPQQYIGLGAMDEILYAASLQKRLYFLEPIYDQACLFDLISIIARERGGITPYFHRIRHISPDMNVNCVYWELF